MDLNTQIKNLVGNRYFHDEKSLSRWIYHNNKFSTVKKSKIPCFAIQKIERVFTRLIVDFKKNHSEAEVDDSTLESLKKFENLVHEKVLDYKSKHGKVYLFFCRLFFGSIDKLSEELIDEIKKLQKRYEENPVKKEQPTPYSIDDELKDNVQNSNSLPDIEFDSNLSQEDIYKKLPVTIVNDCSVDLQEPLVNEDLSKQESDNKPFSDDLEDKWQNVQEVALLFKDSEENFFLEKDVDNKSSQMIFNNAEDNIIQLKYTHDELKNQLQTVQQTVSQSFTKIEEIHLSEEDVDNRPPFIEVNDDFEDVLQDTLVEENLTQENDDKTHPKYAQDDLENDLQTVQQTVSHTFKKIEENHLSEEDVDSRPPFIETNDDLEDVLPDTLVEENLSEVIDNTPSLLPAEDLEDNFFEESFFKEDSNKPQLKNTQNDLENQLQIVQQTVSHSITKIEENHLSEEDVDNKPPFIELKDDLEDASQDTLVGENLTEENGDNPQLEYARDDLENDLQTIQQTVLHTFANTEKNHLSEEGFDNEYSFKENDDFEDALQDTLVEENLSDDVDSNPSKVVNDLDDNIINEDAFLKDGVQENSEDALQDFQKLNALRLTEIDKNHLLEQDIRIKTLEKENNDLRNELLDLLLMRIILTELKEDIYNKTKFEFVCSEEKSLFISIEQQKLLAKKSNYLKNLFFGDYKESYKKICKLPTFSIDDLKEIIEISLGIKNNILIYQRAYYLLLKGQEIELPLPACEKEIIYHIGWAYDPQDLEDFQNIKEFIQTLPLHYVSDQLKEAINNYLIKAYFYFSRTADIQNECKQTCLDLMASLNIKKLKLFNLKINDQELSELIKCYPNLQCLSIFDGEISNQGVIESITKLKHLTNLDLKFCSNLTDQAVVDGISKIEKLNHLKLGNLRNLTDQAVIHGISKLKHLKSIVLTSCLITDRSLIEVIGEMKQLTKLNVNNCTKLTNQGVLEGISKLEKLTSLDLGQCHRLTNQAVIFGIRKLEQLTKLNLSASSITNQAVIDGLSNLKQLRKLNLDQCKALTDQALTDGISKLEQLRSLELFCCNNLTDQGVIDGLGKLEHLKDLNLLNCPSITEEIKKVLSPSIPYILYDGHK